MRGWDWKLVGEIAVGIVIGGMLVGITARVLGR
jgi:hypothetical protein